MPRKLTIIKGKCGFDWWLSKLWMERSQLLGAEHRSSIDRDKKVKASLLYGIKYIVKYLWIYLFNFSFRTITLHIIFGLYFGNPLGHNWESTLGPPIMAYADFCAFCSGSAAVSSLYYIFRLYCLGYY